MVHGGAALQFGVQMASNQRPHPLHGPGFARSSHKTRKQGGHAAVAVAAGNFLPALHKSAAGEHSNGLPFSRHLCRLTRCGRHEALVLEAPCWCARRLVNEAHAEGSSSVGNSSATHRRDVHRKSARCAARRTRWRSRALPVGGRGHIARSSVVEQLLARRFGDDDDASSACARRRRTTARALVRRRPRRPGRRSPRHRRSPRRRRRRTRRRNGSAPTLSSGKSKRRSPSRPRPRRRRRRRAPRRPRLRGRSRARRSCPSRARRRRRRGRARSIVRPRRDRHADARRRPRATQASGAGLERDLDARCGRSEAPRAAPRESQGRDPRAHVRAALTGCARARPTRRRPWSRQGPRRPPPRPTRGGGWRNGCRSRSPRRNRFPFRSGGGRPRRARRSTTRDVTWAYLKKGRGTSSSSTAGGGRSIEPPRLGRARDAVRGLPR